MNEAEMLEVDGVEARRKRIYEIYNRFDLRGGSIGLVEQHLENVGAILSSALKQDSKVLELEEAQQAFNRIFDDCKSAIAGAKSKRTICGSNENRRALKQYVYNNVSAIAEGFNPEDFRLGDIKIGVTVKAKGRATLLEDSYASRLARATERFSECTSIFEQEKAKRQSSSPKIQADASITSKGERFGIGIANAFSKGATREL